MTSSLEEELGISPKATLEVPKNAAWQLEASTNTISISAQTSFRSNPRCLIVGRQARTADIRIQHGSISRKHAALYFLGADCVLEDFGSKKGTSLNGRPLKGKQVLKADDVVMFGNVRESIFKVVRAAKSDDTGNREQSSNVKESAGAELKGPLQIEEERVTFGTGGPGTGLTGRSKREAEIKAMIESLEQTPAYQKYALSAEEVATQSNSLAKSGNNSQQCSSQLVSEHEELDKITQVVQKHKLPIRERMSLSQDTERRHMVTCLAMDPSGARFIVGKTDNALRLYDFGGMDRLKRDPFKMLQADDGHAVSDLCYSSTGDRILVGTGSVQPYVLDRDGGEIIKFVRGDMYVVDQSKTSGHTAAVTGVQWHPLERDIVITSSADGSARLWNLNGKTQFQMLVCEKVFQPKSAKGQRTIVLSIAFHPGGREFAVGTSCGSIQIWNASRVSGRPDRSVYDAHCGRNPVNAVVYSVDGSRLASRSVDDSTCKVWDSKRLSRTALPFAICENVPTLFEHCKPTFSPNGSVICIGTSRLAKSNEAKRMEIGGVTFFHIPRKSMPQTAPLEALLELEISTSSGVTLVQWHPKLNQVFVGCSNGKIEILFDPQLSKNGALLSFVKSGRQFDGLTQLLNSRAPTGSAAVRGTIIAPNALPIGERRKRKRSLDDDDASKSRQPEAPAAGFKTGTQCGAAVNFTQFVVDSRLGAAKTIAGKDPRIELLKYKEGKSYISQAYVGNKEFFLAGKTVEQEEEEQKR